MAKPDDIPPLNQLDEEIREFRGKTARQPVPSPQGAALVMRLGVELASGVVVGSAVGYYLDKWLGTSPFLLILCFFLGFAGGFLTVMKTLKTVENEEDKG